MDWNVLSTIFVPQSSLMDRPIEGTVCTILSDLVGALVSGRCYAKLRFPNRAVTRTPKLRETNPEADLECAVGRLSA